MPNIKSKFWLGVILIWTGHLLLDFMLGVWPVYKTMVTLDLVVAGLIASLSMFIGEGLQLYFGVLSDRGYHRYLIPLGIGLVASIPFLAYVKEEWALFLLVLCSYVGSGAFHPSASSFMASSSGKYKSALIALFLCGGTLGAALSQTVYVKVYTALEGETALLAIPLVLLAIFCLSYSFPKEQTLQNKTLTLAQIGQLIKPYRFELIVLYVITLCFQTVTISFSFLLSDILRVKGYEDWLCLGGGYFYFIIGAALASIPLGLCVDRFGYKRVLGFIIVGAMSLLTAFLHFESLSLLPMTILLMFLGGTLGVIIPVVVAGGNSLVPSKTSGVVSAFYMGGVGCLAGFGPLLATLIASYFTEMAPVRALQVLSSLLGCALCLVYMLPRPAPAYQLVRSSAENLSIE